MAWLNANTDDNRHPPERLKSLYDKAAAGWQDGITSLGFGAAYADLAAAALPTTFFDRVIDVGTGTGALAQAAIDRSGTPAHLTLSDMSAAMLATAAERLPATDLIEGPLGPETIARGPFDLVLCAHVIEHCPNAEDALAALYELTRPGGQLLLAVSKPHWCTALVRWRWGNAAFRPRVVCDMLARAGFTDISTHPFASGPPSRVSCGYSARRV